MNFNSELKVSNMDRAKCSYELLGCPEAPESSGQKTQWPQTEVTADTCLFIIPEQSATETETPEKVSWLRALGYHDYP